MLRLFAVCAAASAILAAAGTAAGAERVFTPSIGTVIDVTAGQQFYAELQVQRQRGYRLARPFRSSMAGAGGLPFGFALDDTVLVDRLAGRPGRDR